MKLNRLFSRIHYSMKTSILICIVLIVSVFSSEEEHTPEMRCGTENEMKALYARNPQSKIDANYYSQISRSYSIDSRPVTLYKIPVVFHIFGTDFAGKSITDAIITDALAKTNTDFQGGNADWTTVFSKFSPIKRSLDIEFKLAKKDPQGKPTTGIVYHPLASGFGNGSGFDSKIQQYAWDNYKYMNVYVMLDLYNDGDYYQSGVAWYPDKWMSDNNLARVVYNGRYIGKNTDENFRRVLTHEFGHFLNLIHTFENGCEAINDEIDDTPPTKSNSGSCNVTNERCAGAGIPNGENFMDYTNCYKMFTAGQVARMIATLETNPTRRSLWQPQNLSLTGISDELIQGVFSDFTSLQVVTSTDKGVKFTNTTQTEAGTSITSSVWTFKGGTPSSYNGVTPPEIFYKAEGSYDVQLVSTNSKGISSTKLKPAYVTVKNEYCQPTFNFGTYSHIGNVKLNEINNTTGESGMSSNVFIDSHVANISKNSDNRLSVTVKIGNSGDADTVRVRGWIDWNRDWIFDSSESILTDTFAVAGGDTTVTTKLTIPQNAVVGKTAMRILCCYKQNSDGDGPCDNADSGEKEDYGIMIQNGSVNVKDTHNESDCRSVSVNAINGKLTFGSSVPEGTKLTLWNTSGRIVYSTIFAQATQSVNYTVSNSMLFWKLENHSSNGFVMTGKVLATDK